MPSARVNGVELHYELAGSGEPLALVHGSWVDHRVFDRVAPQLEVSFRVLRYDRRGHGRSERPPGPGSVHEDAGDLAALLERLGLAPALVAGVSWGASVALWLAGDRPDTFRGLAVHEPPLFALLDGEPAARAPLARLTATLETVEADLDAGRWEPAARRYVDQVAYGPGAWDGLDPSQRRSFVDNAPTYLDQCRDPDQMRVDLDALSDFAHPVLVTEGDRRRDLFGPITDRLCAALPAVRRATLPGTAHDPQLSDPDAYAGALTQFATRRVAAGTT